MRVLIDVDGVLAQWKVRFKKYLSDVGFEREGIAWESAELPISPYQMWYAWDRMSQPGIAFELEPYPQAIVGVKKLIADGHDVYFVTAQVEKSPTWAFDRTCWLIKHFGEGQGKKVVFTHHKYLVKGDVFIDDKEYNVAAWLKEWPNGMGVLWDHPQNKEHKTVGVRHRSWYKLGAQLRRNNDKQA